MATSSGRVGRCAVLAAVAGLLVSGAGVLAQTAHVPPAERNAALQYWPVFYADMPKELTDAVDAVDLSETGLDADSVKQSEKYQAAATEAKSREGTVLRIVEATKLDKCDFEIAYEQGINALLPHLGMMRKAARLLRFDARRMLVEGSPDAAAERVASIYRLSRHLKGDNTLISSLVAIAVAGLGNGESQALIKSGKLTATGREQILAAIDSLGNHDPYGVKDAVLGEREITVTWVRKTYPPPGSGKAFANAMRTEWGMGEGSKAQMDEIEAMDDAAFAAALGKLDEYHRLLQAQWDLPDAKQRLEAMTESVGRGDFGLLAKFLAPSFAKARSGQAKAEAELETAAKALKNYVPPAAK